jgi:hypothetical protein
VKTSFLSFFLSFCQHTTPNGNGREGGAVRAGSLWPAVPIATAAAIAGNERQRLSLTPTTLPDLAMTSRQYGSSSMTIAYSSLASALMDIFCWWWSWSLDGADDIANRFLSLISRSLRNVVHIIFSCTFF